MTDRQTKIFRIVYEQNKVEGTGLSELLNVSQVTIRKGFSSGNMDMGWSGMGMAI